MQELIKALIKARSEFDAIEKNAKAYNYKYATLAEVSGAITPALCANGLVIIQPIEATEVGTILRTQLWHESGQMIESAIKLPDLADVQKLGSAITYLRRYSINALLGICPEDDDGAAAVGGKSTSSGNGNGTAKKSYSTSKPATLPPPPKPPVPQAMTAQELNQAKKDLGVAPPEELPKVPAVTVPTKPVDAKQLDLVAEPTKSKDPNDDIPF